MEITGLILFSQLLILIFLGVVLSKLRTQSPQPHVLSIDGYEVAEQEQGMELKLTAGGKKMIRFIPLNKFGAPSAWDADGLPHVVTSEGPATFEATAVDFAGAPLPADQAGQWFILKSNGASGATETLFEGDGHVEAEGEEESVKTVAWTVAVNAVAADVESVMAEESAEIAE
jgi:hypothetical protein